MKKIEMTIDPNEIKTRDPFMFMIISGATKANIQTDHKKENSKKNCRRKVDRNFED